MNQIEIKVAKSDLDFVGIECRNNIMKITFPVGYNIEENKFNDEEFSKLEKYHSDVLLLIKILQKNNENYFDDGLLPFNFSAAVYLINDYFKNGLINKYKYNNTRIETNNINWEKTINSKIPFYSNGNFVYWDKVYKKVEDTYDDITQIQKFCLHKSFLILKIFYNGYDIYSDSKFTKEEMLYKIKNALNETNVDENKKRLNMMKEFINGTSLSTINNEEIKIGMQYFNKKWEDMLRKNIKDKYDFIDELPQAYYVPREGKKIYVSKLVPDIVFEDENYIYIVDAKYYKIGSLPQTSDISKQLIYAMYISRKIKNKPIKNIFLLPNTLDINNPILDYGYATMEIENSTKNIKVETYFIDTKYVLQKY